MKKILLSSLTMVMAVSVASAEMYTFNFEGTESYGGMTRQHVTGATEDMSSSGFNDIQFQKECSFEGNGIELSFKDLQASGKGFALIDYPAGGQNVIYNGLAAYGATTFPNFQYRSNPEGTISVKNAKITKVKVAAIGKGVGVGTEMIFNGASPIVNETEGTPTVWTWSNEEGLDQVTFTFSSAIYNVRVIQYVEVTYQADLGGKEPSGLNFKVESTQAIMGLNFNAPVIENPNNLPLTWSSSKESVATVDSEGNITIVGKGKTFITASTDGNDTYGPGSANYSLEVIPSADSIKEMYENASGNMDQIYVNFPMTVTYASGNNAYVIDQYGTASYIHNIKNDDKEEAQPQIYSVGQVIPAGWVATARINRNESRIVWYGLPPEVEETVAVEYPTVTSIDFKEDAEKIVVLQNVVFSTATKSDDAKFYGDCNGESYEFRNTFGVGSQAAGTYDVKVIVNYNIRQSVVWSYLTPISYIPSTVSGIDEVTLGEKSEYYTLQGVKISDIPSNGVYIKVTDGKASKVLVK